jgi:hypothetical protein
MGKQPHDRKAGNRTRKDPRHKQLEDKAKPILNLVKAGNHPAIAAVSAGVPRSTYYRWEKQGRAGEEPYAKFIEAIAQAQAECEAREVVNFQRASTVDKHKIKCPECEHEWETDFLAMLTSAGMTERAQRIKTACAQNSASLLALRFPKRWAPRVTHTIEEEHERLLDCAERVLAPEVFEQLLEAYLAEGEGEPPPSGPAGEQGSESVH